MKKIIALFSAVFIFTAAAFSQSAEAVTRTLNTKEVTCGQAAYFFASAGQLIKDNATEQEALSLLQSKKYISDTATVDKPVTLGQVSYLCVCTWNVKGSLFLSVFPGERYAFRQLKADGVLNAFDDPSLIPDGHKFLGIITDCMDLYETEGATE